MNNCILCKKSLGASEFREVQKKGVTSLLEAARIREDKDVVEILSSRTSVTVHIACQKKYADQRSALTEARRKNIVNKGTPLSLLVPGRPSSSENFQTPLFDFNNLCLFCGEHIDERHRLRREIRTVMKKEISDSILKCLEDRHDDFALVVKARVKDVVSLVEVGARYHLNCARRIYQPPIEEKRKSLTSMNVDSAVEYIFSYLEDNKEECQFSLSSLMNQIEGEYKPDSRTVLKRLEEKYGNDIIIMPNRGRDTTILLKSIGYKLFRKEWYDKKSKDDDEETVRFLKEAARVLKSVIRSKIYDTSSFPPSDNFLSDVEENIPAPLRIFLHELVVSDKRGSLEHWQRVSTSIAHQMISAVRPRSFFSTLKLNVGAFIYKNFGSRLLIDICSSLGVSASYTEVRKYEETLITKPEPNISSSAFTQFVFDNADSNINTLTGHNTFHSMGGFMCVTPSNAVEKDVSIQRPTRNSLSISDDFRRVEIIPYTKGKNVGLKKLLIVDVNELPQVSKTILPTIGDFMWLYGKWTCAPGIPSWNGFMEMATSNRSFEKTKIIYLPFIHGPPSEYNTIHTALLEAIQRSKGKKCIITFDQPLYVKSRDIVAAADDFSDLKNVVIRLGGFHLIMSYLGSVGYIMAGSGLEDALQLIYASNSVDKILSGHAYSRAVRAHFLVYTSLGKIIVEEMALTNDERSVLELYLYDLDRSQIFEAAYNEEVTRIQCLFEAKLSEIEERGPTAAFWIQYFRMITLLRNFIEAERTGNWNLHLETIQRMLPIFHASGHFLYAKSARLYLQDMRRLSDSMLPEEFEQFTGGFFTMRFNEEYWPSFFSDLTIECMMMRPFKSNGGMTIPGRGITERTVTKWTLGMQYLLNVCCGLEKFCGVYSMNSEQHVDLRPSRISRDNADIEKLDTWLNHHNPFPETNDLYSLSTGVVGGKNINCHKSFAIGSSLMAKINGKTFDSLTFSRSDKVLPLIAISSSIKINSTPVTVDPMKLFQRLLIVKHSEDDLKNFLCYELSPYPLSLFTEDGMRKGTKSSLYSCFKPLEGINAHVDNRSEVVDGGWLLHTVVWDKNTVISHICRQYVSYIHQHFSENVLIVFDGYPDKPEAWGTKAAERLRRSFKKRASDIVFNNDTIIHINQENFLANEKNKKNFINCLSTYLRNSSICVAQASEDADVLIVNSALCNFFDSVFIIGSDIDLLVLLTGLCPKRVTNVFFRKPKKGNIKEEVFAPSSFKYGDIIAENILFLHAFSGCDTTSSFFNIGKTRFITVLEKNPDLHCLVNQFKQENVDPNGLEVAGKRFIIALYEGKSQKVANKNTNEHLNALRYKCFLKSSTTSKANFATLPPTEEAAKHHTYRTYYQVQTWLNNQKNPEDWGWKKSPLGLIPVTTSGEAAPQSILNLVSCKCTKNCSKACGCRRDQQYCTAICRHCCGETCSNVPPKISPTEESEYEDEDDEILRGPTLLSSNNQENSSFFDENGNESPGPFQKKRKLTN